MTTPPPPAAPLDLDAARAFLNELAEKFERETQVFLGFKNVVRAEQLRSLAASLAAIEEGQRDTERLDWLDERRDPVRSLYDPNELAAYAWHIEAEKFHVRAAIDAAMRAPTDHETERPI
jgi:hypothetical protein